MIDTARPAVGRRGFLLGAGATLLAGRAAALAPDETVLVGASGLDPANLGFLVVDASDGREISAHNPDTLFIPASVTKLPSILAAVGILGPQHRFRTRLVVEGPLPGRVNQQRLVLVGGGDPALDGDKLAELARALARAGPRRYAAFGYDDSLLATVPRIVADQPETAAFNPGIGALSLNFNRVFAGWRRSADGVTATTVASVAARTRVPVDWITVRPQPGPAVAHQIVRGREEWSFALDPPEGASLWLPVRNPGHNAAMAFRALARGAGITLPLPQRVIAAEDAREIATIESDSLVDIARAVLRFSNNPATELIGLGASRALTGRALDLSASAAALTDWLKARTPRDGTGVDWTGLRFVNHSGLSGQSRASPRHLAAMVRAARASAYAPAELAALLPQVSARAQAESDAEIDAKTGTMWFASGLAGIGHTRNGRPVVFAAFAVDWQRRAALDAMVGPRPPQGPDGARAWTLRTRGLINDLARQWARA